MELKNGTHYSCRIKTAFNASDFIHTFSHILCHVCMSDLSDDFYGVNVKVTMGVHRTWGQLWPCRTVQSINKHNLNIRMSRRTLLLWSKSVIKTKTNYKSRVVYQCSMIKLNSVRKFIAFVDISFCLFFGFHF